MQRVRGFQRAGAALASLIALAALGACSGSDEGGQGDVPPTKVGDVPRVAVVDAGAADGRRALRLDVEDGAAAEAELTVEQAVASGGSSTPTVTLTVPVTTTVTSAGDDEIAAERAYGAPRITPAALAGQLADVEGETTAVTAGTDGIVTTTDDSALTALGDQLVLGPPVLPAEEVGVGAVWTSTEVVEVAGVPADRVVTYTLDSLDGDDYVLSLGVALTYRAAEIDGVQVQSGRASATGRMAGSLTRFAPDQARSDGTTTLYVVQAGGTTEVSTTIATRLASG